MGLEFWDKGDGIWENRGWDLGKMKLEVGKSGAGNSEKFRWNLSEKEMKIWKNQGWNLRKSEAGF